MASFWCLTWYARVLGSPDARSSGRGVAFCPLRCCLAIAAAVAAVTAVAAVAAARPLQLLHAELSHPAHRTLISRRRTSGTPFRTCSSGSRSVATVSWSMQCQSRCLLQVTKRRTGYLPWTASKSLTSRSSSAQWFNTARHRNGSRSGQQSHLQSITRMTQKCQSYRLYRQGSGTLKSRK